MRLCLLVRHMEMFLFGSIYQRPEFTATHFAIHITVVLSLVVPHFIISFPHSVHLSKLYSAIPPTSFQMKTNNITWTLLAICSISHSPQVLPNQENATDSVYGFFQGL